MAKINQEEYEILQFLNNTKDWIVRNPDGQLWAVGGEAPRKSPFYEMWKEGDGQDVSKVDVSSFLFQFIQWEDKEPHNIAELIEEYETPKSKNGGILIRDVLDMDNLDFTEEIKELNKMYKESEETEVKKQKLIEKWESAIGAAEFYGRGKEDRLIEYMRNFVDDLNQLDEPEVLSEEWIEENKEDSGVHYIGYYVPIGRLHDLLVPKPELPVIPKFVADWIESRKNNYPFDVIGVYLRMNELSANEQTREVLRWVHKSKLNRGSFARAWLDGYEIEQEPRYYAKIKGHENIASNDKYWNYNTDMEELSVGDSEVHPNVISEYTIKATKDEWANLGINDDNADFVLVEEMEE